MPTKLSRYCLGIMEAAWLAAVCIVPIFFNLYSSRIFEPDKITILRSLALVTLGAWIIKIIDEGGIKWGAKSKDISLIMYILRYPMMAPVLGLIGIYLLATIFSVTPSISFFGSYQRLQGTYTTFSYLVIFFSIITNLRTRNQINRLFTTLILASLPVSLYGLLQRYHIDPIPWGANVSIRIASTMGNSIFVAAYLIMVFPLTFGRIIESFRAILLNDDQEDAHKIKITNQTIKATIYIFIALLQLIAIYMSGSRGPLLGFFASMYLLILLLSIFWRKRWLTFVIVGIAFLGATFLVIFNLQNGPLEKLKSSPAIGRFGKLLDPESNSALVRQYIWEGTVKLVGVHSPLKFPDGTSDPFNFLRPIIGYGPEAMYVAYNQFYQPELGQVEKRNASPDRAHNETWDSLVITGFIGLFVYLALFSSIIYNGIKWQGLVSTSRKKVFFFVCLFGGGILAAIGVSILRGIEYLGVGLPFGMIIGVVIYLTTDALLLTSSRNEIKQNNPNLLLLIFLFAAIIGHFVEINFGIAIVATRTLFWVYTGVMLVVGYILPNQNFSPNLLSSHEEAGNILPVQKELKKDRSGLRRQRYKESDASIPIIGDLAMWVRFSLICGVMIGIIIATLGYDYVTNSSHSTSPMAIVISSISQLSNQGNVGSLGVLVLVATTWIVGTFLFLTESEINGEFRVWLKVLGLIAVSSLIVGFVFWFLHAISLAILAGFTPANQNDVIQQVNGIGSLLTKYYFFIFLILLFLAFLLPEEWPQKITSKSPVKFIVVPVVLFGVMGLIFITNLRVIHADITFKMAEPFSKSSQWKVATFLYKRALELVPKEDHYYLFLGRSYLEQAKTTETVADQDNLILQAENDLKVAQSINPLNTDHTANLARLFSWWAGKALTNSDRTGRAQQASDYYQTAVTLSPNNSTLWDEWAVLSMQIIGNADLALSKLQHALELDPKYSFTQGLFGDYYLKIANSAQDNAGKKQALEKAIAYYQAAADVSKVTDQTSKGSYLVSLANAYIMMAGLDPNQVDKFQLQQAIDTLLESINAGINANDMWKIQESIAKLYLQLGDKSQAQYYANLALQSAPNSAIERIQSILTQTLSSPE